MKIILISPALIGQKDDMYGNIPSLPVGIAYLAGYLRDKKYEVKIIDAFGLSPERTDIIDEKYVRHGLNSEEVVDLIDKDAGLIGISVHSVAIYSSCKEIICEIRKRKEFSKIKIVVGGPLPSTMPSDFLNMGADFVLIGEAEITLGKLADLIAHKKKIPSDLFGIAYEKIFRPQKEFIKNLDELPFPAIDLLPLQNYWNLGYAHGPVSSKKYSFLITSRGCPYNCNFCASNAIWKRIWRARSAENIFDEIIYFNKKFGIDEFHIQDEAPTINRKRMIDLCNLIIEHGIKIKLKIAAGTKAETIKIEDLALMKKAGFDYISMSPETGSKRVLELMNKPFDYEYFNRIVKECYRLGIKTQACLVLGFPGETKQDRELTEKYVVKITKLGLDEIVVPIITPLPGATIMDRKKFEFTRYEDLTFSPSWRKDFQVLRKERNKIILKFLIIKSIYHPLKMIKSAINLLRRKFDTKMEMTAYRILKTFINKSMFKNL